MPSLYDQFIDEFQARVAAFSGPLAWGLGGVQRADTFKVEREMRPALRIIEGGADFSTDSKNRTVWGVSSRFTVRVLADSEADARARWLAVLAACEPQWATPGVNGLTPINVQPVPSPIDNGAVVVEMRFLVKFFDVKAWHPDQRCA